MRKEAGEFVLQARIHRDAAVLGDVPVGKELQLARQQSVVVSRQYAGARRELPGNQRVHRVHVKLVNRRAHRGKRVQRRLLLDELHHGLRAQVAEQHEALRFVPGQHARRVQPGFGHQRSDFDEGRAVFERRWRVHDDATARSPVNAINAKVAPETGICRGQAQRGRVELAGRAGDAQPLGEEGSPPRVAPNDIRSAGRVGRRGGHG